MNHDILGTLKKASAAAFSLAFAEELRDVVAGALRTQTMP
jgi:hypothetical protein